MIDRDDLSNLIETLYEVRTGEAAANVIEACLYVPDALVRVAAAAAHTQMARDASPAGLTRPWLWARSFESLMRGVREEDELVRELAATALDVLRSDLPPTFGGTGSKTEVNEADQRYGRQPKPTSVIVRQSNQGARTPSVAQSQSDAGSGCLEASCDCEQALSWLWHTRRMTSEQSV